MANGKVVIDTELDTKKFDRQIKSLEEELDRIDKAVSHPKEYGLKENDIEELNIEAEKLRNKLVDLRSKQEKINNPPEGNGAVEWAEGFGKSLNKSIKKIGRLVLGIFGIRGAYMAVRNAMSVITSDDEQLKADIDYMKNTLAYMLEPVVRRIVDLFKQLMFYVGYIAKAWFGVNIYAKASEKALAYGAKSAKEMRKQLAGFDEMNVVQDSSSGAGSGGSVAPSFDLGDFENMDAPGWLKWIGEHGQDLIPIIEGIGGALVAMRVLGLEPLRAMGIGIAIWGIVNAMREINEYIQDPNWQHFANTLMYIGTAVVGIGIAFMNLPTIIVGVGIAIVGATVKIWDELNEIIDKRIKRLEGLGDYIEFKAGKTVRNLYDAVIGTVRFLFDGIEFYMNSLKMIFDGIINFITGVFTGDWDKAWQGVVQILSGILGVAVAVFQNSVGLILKLGVNLGVAVAKSIGDTLKSTVNLTLQMIEGLINNVIGAINMAISLINVIPGVKIGLLSPLRLPKLAKGGIINMPGRGVPVGSAIAGERGAEGVIPLTDSQQMELLGEAIGKYITVNANIVNTMNGRVISKELQKINNESSFAFNR